jgi:DNA-directed RNA polymerase subunit M/transcription elongation factor TFIIS
MDWIDLEWQEVYNNRQVEQGTCPKCGSNEINYGVVHASSDGTQVYWDWTCPDCDAEGEEWYDINFIRHSLYTYKEQ